MRRRSPPPALSSLAPSRTARTARNIPPSPAYSAPYTPSVYSQHQSEYGYRPSGDYDVSSEDVPISSPLRRAWNDIQDAHSRVELDTRPSQESGKSRLPQRSDSPEGPETQMQFPDADEGPEGSRLSVMGPKMKVLSKAPWELDTTEEEDHFGDDADYGDDGSDAASVFGRGLGRKSRERSRTVTTPNKGVDNDPRAWKNLTRSPRPRPDASLKEMISGPVKVVSSSSDYSSSPATSPLNTHFPYNSLSAASTSTGGSNTLHPRSRTTSQPRSSESTSSTYTTASSYSTAISPSSERFVQSTSNHVLASTDSEHHGPGATPVVPVTIRTESPPTVQSTPRTSEDGPYHPYANPEVYRTSSSPHPYPTSSSASLLSKSLQIPSSASQAASSSRSTITPSSSAAYTRSDSVTTITTPSTPGTLLTTTSVFYSSSLSSVAFPSSPSLGRGTTLPPSSPSLKPLSRKDASRADSDLSGMRAYPGSPAYDLISLEQAQEKIRGRTKSGPGVSTMLNSSRKMTDPTASMTSMTDSLHSEVSSVRPFVTTVGHAMAESSHGPVHGESPPLPALPPPSPSSPVASTPLAYRPATVPAARTLKPKRSGFLKMFGGGDKDKAVRDRLPDGFVHVGMARSVASVEDMKNNGDKDIGRGASSDAVETMPSTAVIPPTPAIPAQFRHYKDPSPHSVKTSSATTSNVSLDSSASSNPSRGREPSPAASQTSPRARTESSSKNRPDLASKIGWGSLTKKHHARTTTLDVPVESASEEAAFRSLEVRPMSSLFSSGLPVDLMLPTSPTMPSVMENANEAAKPGSSSRGLTPGVGPRRRPDLGISLPSRSPIEGHNDLYSPTTASSMSSSYSAGRSTPSTATTNGPLTPTSSWSMTLTQPSSSSGPGSASTLTTSFGPSHQHQPPPSPNMQVQMLQDRLVQERKGWQLQRWEYEAQIRDLENQLAEMRATPCDNCGAPSLHQRREKEREEVYRLAPLSSSMIDRPRARSGTSAAAAPHLTVSS